MPADSLFKLLTSMDGKRVIDPFPREHHAEPVKVGDMSGLQDTPCQLSYMGASPFAVFSTSVWTSAQFLSTSGLQGSTAASGTCPACNAPLCC